MEVVFPNGTRIGLVARPTGRAPERRERSTWSALEPTWPAELIDSARLRAAARRRRAASRIRAAFAARSAAEGVEIGAWADSVGRDGARLHGGLAGVDAEEAVAWVREHGRPNDVETPDQERRCSGSRRANRSSARVASGEDRERGGRTRRPRGSSRPRVLSGAVSTSALRPFVGRRVLNILSRCVVPGQPRAWVHANIGCPRDGNGAKYRAARSCARDRRRASHDGRRSRPDGERLARRRRRHLRHRNLIVTEGTRPRQLLPARRRPADRSRHLRKAGTPTKRVRAARRRPGRADLVVARVRRQALD